MSNPYIGRPEKSFWKKAVASKHWAEMYPVSESQPIIKRDMRIAAAGSCFAQKVATYIKSNEAINFVELESVSAGQPIFSARYGNIYTTRQLLELIQEAESSVVDKAAAVQREDGRFVDVYRPFVEEAGFESASAVEEARAEHLSKVRQMFRESDVFVFTLGLTEAWVSKQTGRTFPVCPGIFTDQAESEFVNYGFQEVLADLQSSLALLSKINANLKVVVTVSPVPLTATYTDEHIMSATTYSKSVLRTVCEEVTRENSNVHYFPSYEIVVNPYRDGNAFEDNKRSVKQDVVDVVMKTFEYAFLDEKIHTHSVSDLEEGNIVELKTTGDGGAELEDEPVCDDVQIEKSVGF